MKKRICIGIPCFAGVSGETLEDYMRFAYHLGRRYQEFDFFLSVITKKEQFRARNIIVESALTVGCDWLLMLDDDQKIDTTDSVGDPETGAAPYDFLRQLIEHDVDIVGPVYYQRGGGVQPVVMDEDEQGMPYFISDIDLGNGLEERAVQGGGCLLMNMRIFDKIPSPWFEPEFKWGTDIQICKKAREAGFKVYNDSSLEIGHEINDKVVLTSKNKHLYKGDTPGTTESEVEWKTDSILHKYKTDAAKYLGVKENDIDKEFDRLQSNYGMQSLLLATTYGDGTREYYQHMGPEQLARQVMVHYNPTAKATLAAILQEINQQKLVGMDFGCGSAPVGFELARRGGFMHFVDVDGSKAYEFTKWRCKQHGFENVSFDWPEPSTLNYCLCLDSIEHLTDWQTALFRIIDCLKPGGNLMTNFMQLTDEENAEHVFMDKSAFMGFMVSQGMRVHSGSVFVKDRR